MNVKKNWIGKYVIAREPQTGVFAGILNEISDNGKQVLLKNARRIWYWDGAASLSQLAMEGTKKPENCKFPCEVDEVLLINTCEIIPCTKIAEESIKGVSIWEA